MCACSAQTKTEIGKLVGVMRGVEGEVKNLEQQMVVGKLGRMKQPCTNMTTIHLSGHSSSFLFASK
jgi:hypothetical protein